MISLLSDDFLKSLFAYVSVTGLDTLLCLLILREDGAIFLSLTRTVTSEDFLAFGEVGICLKQVLTWL